MKFKKVMALVLASAMVFSMAACGGDSGSSGETKKEDSGDSGESDGGELSVSIWDTNQEPGLKEILADFTEETGIKTSIGPCWKQVHRAVLFRTYSGCTPMKVKDICLMTCFWI